MGWISDLFNSIIGSVNEIGNYIINFFTGSSAGGSPSSAATSKGNADSTVDVPKLKLNNATVADSSELTPGVYYSVNPYFRINNPIYQIQGNSFSLARSGELRESWQYNFSTNVGPNSLAAIDAQLGVEDIQHGYHLEYDEYGVLRRVTADGRMHPFDSVMHSILENAVNQTTSQTLFEGTNVNPKQYVDGIDERKGLTWAFTQGVHIDSSGRLVVNNEPDSTLPGDGVEIKARYVDWNDIIYRNENYENSERMRAQADGQFKKFAEDVAEPMVDAAINEKIINQLKDRFTIGKVQMTDFGPAATLEILVDKTPGGVLVLKGIAKYGGGVIAVGHTVYKVYADFRSYGLTASCAKIAAAEVGTTLVVGAASTVAIGAGAPVIAVSLASGVIVWLVDTELIDPLKESL